MTFWCLGSARGELLHDHSEASLKMASCTLEEIASTGEWFHYETVIRRCDKRFKLSQLALAELVSLSSS